MSTNYTLKIVESQPICILQYYAYMYRYYNRYILTHHNITTVNCTMYIVSGMLKQNNACLCTVMCVVINIVIIMTTCIYFVFYLPLNIRFVYE